MKFLGAVFLAVFAVVLVHGDEDNCFGEEILNCFDILRTTVSSESEKCGVVKSSIECLRNNLDRHLGDERTGGIDVGLENLEKFLSGHCEKEEEAKKDLRLRSDDKDECTEKRAKDCLLILSSDFKGDKETCSAISSALKCLRGTEDKCLDDYSLHIKDLEKRFWRRCTPTEENVIEDCPKLLTKDFGFVLSPGFPNIYPDSTDCWTLIQVEKGKRIFFKEDWGRTDCWDDYVEIFDGEDKDSPLLGELCNTDMVASSSNSMLVHFHSDESENTEYKYHARYIAVNKTRSSPLWDMDAEILEEYPECVRKYADFIFGCVNKANGELEAHIFFEEYKIPKYGSIYNVGERRCRLYTSMADCFTFRTKRACGEEARIWANQKMSDLLESHALDASTYDCSSKSRIEESSHFRFSSN